MALRRHAQGNIVKGGLKVRALLREFLARTRRWPRFYRVLLRGATELPYLVNMPWAAPMAVGLRLLAPWKTIRLGPVMSTRIGHFTSDGAEQVVRYRTKSDPFVDMYYFSGGARGVVSCNEQWERMLRRSLPFGSQLLKFVDHWNKRLPGHELHHRPSSLMASTDTEGLFSEHDAAIAFLPSEEEEAKRWLQSKGWRDGEPFVCLLVRDSAYLTHSGLHGDGSTYAEDLWSYHSFRDSSIATYIEAIEWLNEKKIWVLRMGRIAQEPVPYADERFVDYPFDGGQSDLLDIWLFANASAVISTGSGPDRLAPIYRHPLLLLNYLPAGNVHTWCDCVTFPKTLKDGETGRVLTMREHFEAYFLSSVQYEAANLIWCDMTSQEILESVMRFWDNLDDFQPYNLEGQLEVWKELTSSSAGRFHDFRHPKAVLDPAWIKKVGG